MKLWQAVILGLVQGVAGLLPVSASGHLRIFGAIFGLPDATSGEMLLMRAMLHLGTLFAIVFACWRDILRLLFTLLEMLHLRKPDRHRRRHSPDRRMVFLLLTGTLPMALALLFHNWAAALGGSLFFIGAMLLLNGLVVYFTSRSADGDKSELEITLGDALLIGLAQLAAVIPGVSRTGLTVSVGMRRGCDRELAVKFSLLLLAPASLGAAITELVGAVQLHAAFGSMWLPCLLGMLVAAVSGYAAIRLLRFVVQKNSFAKFAYYCWGAGLVALVLALIYV